MEKTILQKLWEPHYLTGCSYVMYTFHREFILLEFPECQGTPCSKQLRYLKFKWLQRDLNPQPLSSLLSMITWFQLNCNFSALLLVSSRHFYRSIKVTSQYLHWWWSFKTSLKSSLSNSKIKLPSRMLHCDWIEKD